MHWRVLLALQDWDSNLNLEVAEFILWMYGLADEMDTRLGWSVSAEYFQNYPPEQDLIDFTIDNLEHKDPRIRQGALRFLMNFRVKSERVAAFAGQIIKAGDDRYKNKTSAFLIADKTEISTDTLLSFLDDSVFFVVIEAAKELIQRQDARIIPALRQAAEQHPDTHTRTTLLRLLNRPKKT